MRRIGTIAATMAMAAVLSGCPGEVVPSGACVAIEAVPIAGHHGRGAQVSADGRHLAYLLDDQVRVLDPVTGADVLVSQHLPDGLDYFGLQITPEGDRLAVLSGRRAWIVDIATTAATELDWSGVDWPNYTFTQGFSADLSVYVTLRFGTQQFRVIPSDGSPVRFVTIPADGVEINGDGSTLAGGFSAWRNGRLTTLPWVAGPWDGVRGIDRSGSRIHIGTPNGGYLWNPDSGAVEPLSLPGAAPGDGEYGWLSDDANVFVGGATIDGVTDVWRIDRITAEAVKMPPQLDGVTSLSDDGRLMTSTVNEYFRCTG